VSNPAAIIMRTSQEALSDAPSACRTEDYVSHGLPCEGLVAQVTSLYPSNRSASLRNALSVSAGVSTIIALRTGFACFAVPVLTETVPSPAMRWGSGAERAILQQSTYLPRGCQPEGILFPRSLCMNELGAGP